MELILKFVVIAGHSADAPFNAVVSPAPYGLTTQRGDLKHRIVPERLTPAPTPIKYLVLAGEVIIRCGARATKKI